jgi:hypothetical protein
LVVENATTLWAAAREAGEWGLEKTAVRIYFEYWGEVVRTRGFREMRRERVVELCGWVGRGPRVVDPAGKFEGSEAGDVSEGEEIEEDDEAEENEDMEY